MKITFFLSNSAAVTTAAVRAADGGRSRQQVRPAFIPAFPTYRFFYRVAVRHYLIEATTGLALCVAGSRKDLHREVAGVAARHGVAGLEKAIKKAVNEEAKVLYALTCKRPARRKPTASHASQK